MISIDETDSWPLYNELPIFQELVNSFPKSADVVKSSLQTYFDEGQQFSQVQLRHEFSQQLHFSAYTPLRNMFCFVQWVTYTIPFPVSFF